MWYNILNLEEISKIYSDIDVQINEDKIVELGFKTESIANKFVKVTSRLSIIYREDRTRYSLQFLADIVKRLIEENKICFEDLYTLKEEDIINVIKNSKYSNVFNTWQNAKKVKISKQEPKNVYYVHHGAKIRYINPLVNGKRISAISKIAKEMIDENLAYDMSNYVYLDFNF